jgi:hypothetical protein
LTTETDPQRLKAELRDLASAVLDISADARRFSKDLSATIVDMVAVQCEALEERAQAVLDALERVEP